MLNQKSKTIFIDESGTLPDPKDKVVIIAAIGTQIPRELAEINKKVRKKIRGYKKPEEIIEIKFYQAGDRTKKEFLNELVKYNLDIFVLIIEKNNQKIKDSPENFALLCYILLKECLIFYQDKVEEIIFDRHFHRQKDQQLFNQILESLLKKKYNFKHFDSINHPEINTADMVAGSLLWKYTDKNKEFYEIIRERIVSEMVINWKEAKRKFFQTKNST